MRSYLWTASIAYFITGLATVLLGSVLPQLLIHYQVSYTAGGQLVFLQFIGFLAGVPLSSWLIPRIGYKKVLVAAAFCIGILLFGLWMLPPYGIVCALSMGNGLGIAATETVVATFIMEVFVGRRAVVISYMEVAFGLGALGMPIAASFLIAHQAWRGSFLLVAILALGVSFLWMFVTITSHMNVGKEKSLDAVSEAPQATGRYSQGILLSLYLLLIFLYVGVESSLSGFLPAIFAPLLHQREDEATLSIATLWSAMVIGRIITSWMIRRVSYARYLFWSIIGTLAFLIALAVFRNLWGSYLLVWGVGLSMSGVYSITMVYANHAFPGGARLVTGLLTASAGIGGAVLPLFIGYALDHLNPSAVLWIFAGFGLLLLLSLLGILLMGSLAPKKTSTPSIYEPNIHSVQ
jgi:MFS transporter, FHS family, glucose/mannose:H+ symporter